MSKRTECIDGLFHGWPCDGGDGCPHEQHDGHDHVVDDDGDDKEGCQYFRKEESTIEDETERLCIARKLCWVARTRLWRVGAIVITEPPQGRL